jgi:hypothetical protein
MFAGQALKGTTLVVIRPVQGTLPEILSSIGGNKGFCDTAVFARLDEIDLPFSRHGSYRDASMTGVAIPVVLCFHANPY